MKICKNVKLSIFITIYLSLSVCTIRAEIFRWVDQNNTTHYTDDLSAIPQKYRSDLKEIRETKSVKKGQSKRKLKSELSEKERFDPLEEKQKGVILYGGGINFRPDKEGKALFSGNLKNITDNKLNSVVIFFQLKNKTGNILDVISTSVAGSTEDGVLLPGEISKFEISGKIEYTKVVAYDYKITWKLVANEESVRP